MTHALASVRHPGDDGGDAVVSCTRHLDVARRPHRAPALAEPGPGRPGGPQPLLDDPGDPVGLFRPARPRAASAVVPTRGAAR